MKKYLNKILFCILPLIILLLLPQAAYSDDGSGSFIFATEQTGANTYALGKITGSETLQKQGKELMELSHSARTKPKPKACEKDSKTKCMPYCKYEAVEECFLCPVFAVVFNTVSSIGSVAISAFSNSVVRVVIVAFAIWLAIQILLFASSPETRDLKDLLQSMITQGFVVMIVVAIIETGVANFFKTFVNPVYTTGQSMAQIMFSADVCSVAPAGSECNEEDSNIIKKSFSSIREIPNGLPQSMGNSIMQTMTMMENRVRQFKALGSAMMCQSWEDGWFIFPKPIYLLTGLFIWVLCMAMIVGVPFLMVDSVFQLSVAAALLPIAVGCFAFKSTRQYSKKVWETFLNSMFAFLFISIVVVIVLGTLQSSITAGVEDAMKGLDISEGELAAAFNKMFDANGAAETYFDELLKSFHWASPHFIRLIFVFVLAWSVMSMAKDLSGEFADSISSTSIGSSIGTMAASTAKGMGLKATNSIGKATGQQLSKGVQGIARNVRFRARDFAKTTKRNIINQFGEDKNGVKELTVGFGRFKRKYTLENGQLTRETKKSKVTEFGNKSITLVRTKSVVNGKEVFHDKVKLNSDRLHRALREDGTVNAKEMASMLEGFSGEQRKMMQAALTKAVIEQRFGRDAHQYGRARLLSSETIVDGKGSIIVKEIDINGRVILSQMKMNDDGYLEASITRIDKDGNVVSFSNDGVRTKMESFGLEDGTDITKLNSAEDARAAKSEKKKSKVSYGYTKFWQQRVDQGLDESKIPLGAMSASEVYGETVITDKDGKIIGRVNEKGEILDANGNVIARTWVKGNLKDKDGNIISKYGDYKEKRIGGEFNKFVHSKGNEFQKGDMEWYFR